MEEKFDPSEMATKEFESIFKYFFKTENKNKEITFYAEHEGYYPYFEGVIEELIKRGKTISYITSDFKDPILKTQNPHIKSFYIDKALPIFMRFVNAKLFIMTLTDLDNFYLKRSFNKNVKYLYIFHSLVSTHMMYRKFAFANYHVIFCAGPHHIKELRKQEDMYSLPKKELVEAGYYRLERIYNNFISFPPKKDKQKQILIAPSWGEKNILESMGEKLVDTLLKDHYKVIVRPHPETVKRNPELIENLEKKFSPNENFKLEKSVKTDTSLLESDLLICDLSGVALEYALGTERPVLFIDVPFKIKNKDYKELGIKPLEISLREKIGKVFKPEDIDGIRNGIKNLLAEKNQWKETLSKIRNEIVFSFGKSSEIICNYIENITQNPHQ